MLRFVHPKDPGWQKWRQESTKQAVALSWEAILAWPEIISAKFQTTRLGWKGV
jgi:hypothetical protein